jgi:small subunit ribosomal protein S15
MIVGVMTVRILALSDHLAVHRNDKATKRALNMLVHQRQKMLKYLRRKAPDRYKAVLEEIGLDDIAVVQEVR